MKNEELTFEAFVVDLWELVRGCPKEWRTGQSVFNIIGAKYGDVARQVQFIDGIDCFYDDKQIDAFIQAAWDRIEKDNMEDGE